MLRLWLVVVVLALGAGAAVAQPGKGPTAGQLAAATDAAQAALAAHARERATLIAKKATVDTRYQSEKAAIDRLKQQRKSWRRERQLQDAQAKALDTAKELTGLTSKIAALDASIAADKRAVVKAIDAELPGLPAGARKQQLVSGRAAVAPRAPAKAHKIVVPDAEIDPLADPEELDQQAAAIRASERELATQIEALDAQTARLLKAADLRKAHDRAGDLASRDDDQPRRGAAGNGRSTTLGQNDDPADGLSGSPDDNEAPPTAEGGFQGDETAVVLSDVIDPATGDLLRRAGRASDPAAKADAAKRARDEVAARLKALEKQRAAVEARARQLRKP
jgi:hypothetical protein